MNNTLSALKSGKSPGPDFLTNELYKSLTGDHKEVLRIILNKVLEAEQVPNIWINSLMNILHKKGDKKDPLNYRGIALINTVTKILTTILKKRLVIWANHQNVLLEYQMGFRLDATVRMLFLHYSVLFKSNFATMMGRKFTVSSLAFAEPLALSHIIDYGVLQGEALSPDLFLLFLHDIENFFRLKGLYGLNINGVTDIILLLYADVTVIFAHSHVDLLRKLKTLEEYCDTNGLSVNVNKTKIVIFKVAGRLKEIMPRKIQALQKQTNRDFQILSLYGSDGFFLNKGT